MDTEESPDVEQGVWPPPPTREPLTVDAPPLRPLDRAWLFGQVFGRMLLFGMAFGTLGGAVFGGYVVQGSGIALGLIFGLIYGLVAGILLGTVEGLVLAAVTCAAFFPLTQGRGGVYRNCIILITVIVALAGAWTLSLLLFGSGGGGTIAGGDTLSAVLPTVIATVSAGVASQLVARWYVTVSQTRT